MILRISPKLAEDQCKVDWLQNHHLKLLRKILETIAKSPLAKAITKSCPFLGVSVPLKHPELSAQKLKAKTVKEGDSFAIIGFTLFFFYIF